jgi:hypothetical protein
MTISSRPPKQPHPWRRRLAAVRAWWRRLSLLDRIRWGIAPLVLISLFGVFPWRDGRYDLIGLRNGLVVLAGVILYSVAYQRPDLIRAGGDFIAFLAGAVAFVVTPRTTTVRDFYAVAAQVVPVLFLALAIEHRAFQVSGNMDPSTRHATTLPAVVLLLAGVESFRGVVADDLSSVSMQLVVGSLTMGGVALGLRAMVGPPPTSPHG